MTLSEVASEDARFAEKYAPPLSDELPEDRKIFFLGEHAYGVAAQVSGTTDSTLSVILAVCVSNPLLLKMHISPSYCLVLPICQGGKQ